MKKNYVRAAEKYARDVLSGAIPASKSLRLACQGHFADREREHLEEFPYRFDIDKAESIAAFTSSFIVLEPWQCLILVLFSGWVYKAGPKAGLRRFTQALSLMDPRR